MGTSEKLLFMRKAIAKLLVKYSMPTRQGFIVELMKLYDDKIEEAWKEAIQHSRLSIDVSVKEAKDVFYRKFRSFQ